MLVDGRLRERVLVLADTVDDHVETALADVMRGAQSRHRRSLMTRTGTVAVLLGLTGSAWVGMGWERPRPRPAEETNLLPAPDRERPPAVRFDDRAPADDREHSRRLIDRSEGRRDTDGDARPRRNIGWSSPSSTDATRERFMSGERPTSEMKNDPLGGSTRDHITHTDEGRYEMPVVRTRVDPRHRCSVFRDACAYLDTQPEDRSFRVTVTDDSGDDVAVRVIQWDRYGSPLADPKVYCGGKSEIVRLFAATDDVMVEIDDADCPDGSDTDPRGGLISVVFFDG